MGTVANQTTQELETAREHYRTRVISPEKLAIMDQATRELIASGIKASALKAGDRVEDFVLNDAGGRPVRLQALLGRGPAVISFYRGGWCPYCNIELRGLQRVLEQIIALGASLIAVSPERPDNSLSTIEKNNLSFPVLSDIGNVIARRFGIVYRLPDELVELVKASDLDLAEWNGEPGAVELPMPATFIVDREGVIRLAFVDEDYTKRLDPDEVLTALRGLQR